MMDLEEEVIPRSDNTPSFVDQSKAHGWKAGLFDFGAAENQGYEYFNPGLVRRPDGLWLLVRVSELREGFLYGHNKIWACKLDEELRPHGGPLLTFPDSESAEQFEDPRAVYWNNQTWIACANFTWFEDGSWTGAHQVLGIFTNAGYEGPGDGQDKRWNAIARRDPPVETNLDRAGHTNGRHNKNWVWFFHDGKLHLIYMSDPWHVVEFGSSWDEQTHHKWEGPKWKYGIVRGGTPPVIGPDGNYYTFFHSSVPWRGRYRRYHMGALCFEPRPPFKPVQWTSEPLLSGSQNDPWGQRKPLVVFPCGSVLENDWWTVTMGINDLKCGWVKIPHEDIVKLMKPAPEMPGLALLATPTTRQQHEHIPFEENGGDANCTVTAQRGPTVRDDEQPIARSTEPPSPNIPSQSISNPAASVQPAEPAGPGWSDRIYKPELLSAPVSMQPMRPEAGPVGKSGPIGDYAPGIPASAWSHTCPNCGSDRSGLKNATHDFVNDCPKCRSSGATGFVQPPAKEPILSKGQLQAARMRAALAAKKAAGIPLGTGKKKKKRRRKKK